MRPAEEEGYTVCYKAWGGGRVQKMFCHAPAPYISACNDTSHFDVRLQSCQVKIHPGPRFSVVSTAQGREEMGERGEPGKRWGGGGGRGEGGGDRVRRKLWTHARIPLVPSSSWCAHSPTLPLFSTAVTACWEPSAHAK